MSAMNNFTARYAHARLAATRREDLVQPKKIHGLSAEQNGPYGARDGRIAARVQSGLDRRLIVNTNPQRSRQVPRNSEKGVMKLSATF